MNTSLETAFIDQPPQGYAAFSQKTLLLIKRALSRAKLQLEEVELIGAYICISRGQISPNEDEIIQAFSERSDAEIDEITHYMNTVQSRADAASIDVEDAPGK